MHLTVFTFYDMSSFPSDPSGADILFYLATMTLSSRKTTYYDCILSSNTEHKRFVLLLLIGIYAPSLAGSNRETVPKVVFVAYSITSYYDNSYYVNDLENPDSSGGSSGGGEGGGAD